MNELAKIKFSLVVMSCAALGVLTSCSDDDERIEVAAEVTEEDVAEIVASSLSEEDGGFAADIDVLLEEAEEECGYSETETVTDSETIGVRSFTIEYELSLMVLCDENDNLQQIKYGYTTDREAELIRLDVISSASSSWIFERAGELFTLEGDYNYIGEETSKVRDQNTFNTAFSYESTDLTINEEGDFLAGTMRADYSILSTSGDQKEAVGIINITSTNIALLDVADFEYLYEINLKTGDITQIER